MKKTLLLNVACILFAQSLFAQSLCFDPASDNRYETDELCMDIGVLDVNDDGHLDVVASGGSMASIHLGNGDGTFQPLYTSAPGTNNDIEFIDFDNDGDLDFYSYSSGNCVAGRNLGNGTFEWAGYLGVTLNNGLFTEMSVGDVTGDGNPDIVVNDYNGELHVIQTDDDGIPVSSFIIDMPDAASNVKVGDLNGDALMDIVVSFAINDNIAVYTAQGGTSFQQAIYDTGYGQGTAYETIDIADINDDGDNDILASGGSMLYPLSNDGDGTFTAMTHVQMGSYSVGAVNGDWDGDGDLDIAWANHSGGGVTIRINNGDGTFSLGDYTFFSSNGQSEELETGDFNEDGIPDLIVANGYDLNFAYLEGHGDGKFGSLSLLSGNQASGLCAADFDNDGDMDVIATNYTNPGYLALSKNTGDGSFNETIFLSNAPNSGECVAGDFDEDGNMDIAVHSPAGFHIHIGNGNGTFDAYATYPSQNIGDGGDRTICAGDFNGDGNLDLAGSRIAANNVAVVYGNGDGTFTAPDEYSDGMNYSRILISGYLNNDTYEDIVICSNSSNEVFVYFGTASQNLTSPVILDAPGAPEGLSIFDANEDGMNDLIVLSPNANLFYFFAGNNDMTFDASTSFPIPSGSNATRGAHGDVNQDGHEDFICSLRQDDMVGVFFGNGDGTFQNAISFPVDNEPNHIIAEDFNDDGVIDIATLNVGISNVSVVLNNSAYLTVEGELAMCYEETVTLIATGGYSYLWSNGETTPSMTTATPGTYYCEVTNQAGDCTLLTSSVEVEVFLETEVTLNLDSNLVCVENGQFILSGGYPWGGQYTGTGVNANNFDPTSVSEGVYTITYTYADPAGCTDGTATDELTVDICLGIEEEEFVTEVYPTITSNYINIRTNTSFYTQLYDSNGKLIYSGKRANRFETIDMRALSTGIYLLHITDGTNRQVARVQKVD